MHDVFSRTVAKMSHAVLFASWPVNAPEFRNFILNDAP